MSSAIWFDFFLTRPYEHFTISRRSDIETTLVIIAVAVTELAAWGRRGNPAASRRAGYLKGIYATAEATLTATDPSAVTAQVSQQLTRLPRLKSCGFQVGVAGLGASARLHHDGGVTVDGEDWPADARGLPHIQIELLMQTGGYLQGRFLMQPVAGARPRWRTGSLPPRSPTGWAWHLPTRAFTHDPQASYDLPSQRLGEPKITGSKRTEVVDGTV